MSIREEFPGSCLGTRQGAFDPKHLVLGEHCLLGQPESCRGEQGFVSSFHWYEKQVVQFQPSLRQPSRTMGSTQQHPWPWQEPIPDSG